MTHFTKNSLVALLFVLVAACSPQENTNEEVGAEATTPSNEVANKGQAGVDTESNNVLNIAIKSPDHSTLVAAVQAAEIEHILANNGPFTVFAPVNDAFAALPEGTVDNLLKPENKKDLVNILYYHTAPGIYKGALLTDGRQIYQANGQNVLIEVAEDGTVTVNGAKILATVDGSNGVVHVIDKVLLPPSK